MVQYYWLMLNSKKIVGPYSKTNAIKTMEFWEGCGLDIKLLKEVECQTCHKEKASTTT